MITLDDHYRDEGHRDNLRDDGYQDWQSYLVILSASREKEHVCEYADHIFSKQACLSIVWDFSSEHKNSPYPLYFRALSRACGV